LIALGNVEEYQEKLNIMLTNTELRDNFSNSTKAKVLEYDINKIATEYLNFLLS
jgi:glycosyltransferase involved in cell wall biosynthesis